MSSRDPRGSRADVGQGGNGQIGSLPSCHFCGESMPGYKIPRHIREDHFQGGETDD